MTRIRVEPSDRGRWLRDRGAISRVVPGLLLVVTACTGGGATESAGSSALGAVQSSIPAGPSTSAMAPSTTSATSTPTTAALTTATTSDVTRQTFPDVQITLLETLAAMGFEAQVGEIPGPLSANALLTAEDGELILVSAFVGSTEPLGAFTIEGAERVGGLEFLVVGRPTGDSRGYAFSCNGDTVYEVQQYQAESWSDELLGFTRLLATELGC